MQQCAVVHSGQKGLNSKPPVLWGWPLSASEDHLMKVYKELMRELILFPRLVIYGCLKRWVVVALAWKEKIIVDDWTWIVFVLPKMRLGQNFCLWQINWKWNIPKKKSVPIWEKRQAFKLGLRHHVLEMKMPTPSPPSYGRWVQNNHGWKCELKILL